MKKILLSFYTEGTPHDNGINLIKEKGIFLENAQNHFDKILLFTPRKLIKLNIKWESIINSNDSYFQNHLKASKKYLINLNWAKLNGLMWKPALINMVLNDIYINEGDILIYHDINFSKYPIYKKGIKTFSKLSDKKLKKKSILVSQGMGILAKGVKDELLKKYLGINGYYHFDISGSHLAIKKNDFSIKFCKKWLELTSEEFNRSQITKFSNKKQYIWHLQEMSCLSILVYILITKDHKKHFDKIITMNRKFINDWRLLDYIDFIKYRLKFFLRVNPLVFIKERNKIKTL